jgi:hypothetical protein
MRFAGDAAALETTAISAAEFLYGARLSTKQGVIETARAFLAHFTILPFDTEAATVYAEIAVELRQQGSRISSFDELIAAIALRYDEAVVSRDAHFTAIPGLTVLSY